MKPTKTAVLQALVQKVQEDEVENLLRSEDAGLSSKGEEETHCEAMHMPFMTMASTCDSIRIFSGILIRLLFVLESVYSI